MKNLSKTEAIKEIDDFFLKIKNKKPEEIKKIKKLAMSYNLPLRERRKTFCKKCLNPYIKPKIRIKKQMKSVICEKCGFVSRWKFGIKTS